MIKFLLVLLFTSAILNAASDNCTLPTPNIPLSEISYVGLETTDSIVVQRELIHVVGDTLSCKLWKHEQQRLMNLDIFSSVTFKIDATQGEQHLIYTMQELPAYIIVPTVGKTDQDGWRVGGILASLNFLGRDIRLEAFARFGFKPEFASVQEYMFVASSPYFMSIPLEYQIAYIKTERFNTIEDFREDSHLMQGEFAYPITDAFDILLGARWFYIVSDNSEIMHTKQLNETVNRGRIGISHDTRNARFNPFEGHYAELRVSQTGALFGGDINYTEYLLDIRKYFHPSKHHLLRFYGLGEYRDGSLSRYEYFHSGGANVLAGYDNTAFAGTSELLLTSEYAYEFFHHRSFSVAGINFFLGLQVVGGLDYGIFWEGSTDRHGYAYYGGLHLLVPGAERLRLEFSQNLTALSIDFNAGFFEKSTTRRWHVR